MQSLLLTVRMVMLVCMVYGVMAGMVSVISIIVKRNLNWLPIIFVEH